MGLDGSGGAAEQSGDLLVAVPLAYVAATFCLYAYIAPFLLAQVNAGTGGLAMLLFVFGLTSLATKAAPPIVARRAR